MGMVFKVTPDPTPALKDEVIKGEGKLELGIK
jgi:hypothetical protein